MLRSVSARLGCRPMVARHKSVQDAEHGTELGQETVPRVTPKPEARKTILRCPYGSSGPKAGSKSKAKSRN